MLKFNRVAYSTGANKLGPKNSNVQYFTGTEYEKIDTLVRETIQNPLDNVLDDSCPVEIVFEEMFIPNTDIPFLDEMKSTIEALLIELKELKKTEGGQIDRFIKYYDEAKIRLNNQNVFTLKVSDYNTIGLIGSRNDRSSNLGRFLGSTGYFDDGSTGGGSGGLGKFAPFGSSAINFCFYSSFNISEEYLYYGWGNNFYHKIDGKEYLGEINIGDIDDVLKLNRPFASGFLSERKKKGTDVFILGHQTNFQEEWIDLMVVATIRNFFGSVIDNKLSVKIINAKNEIKIINSITISEYLHLFDKEQRIQKAKGIPADKFILECIEAYQKGTIFNSLNTPVGTPILKECEIRIFNDDDFSKYFAYLRGPRMLIYIKKSSLGDLPYSGVFCCKSEEGNKLLRNIEDSHHKDWNFENHGEQKKIKGEINEFIKYCINEVASHDSEDSFGLYGTSIFSIGSSRESESGNETAGVTEKETSIIYPKNSFKSKKTTTLAYGGEVVVDKDGRIKKIEPKKPKYKKPLLSPEDELDKDNKINPKRQYTVSDFKAMIFKNDSVENEYHLFIHANFNTDIRNISFSIPGADGISFIKSIENENGDEIARDLKFTDADNVFENFELNTGRNKFVVKTKFNQKVEILIK